MMPRPPAPWLAPALPLLVGLAVWASPFSARGQSGTPGPEVAHSAWLDLRPARAGSGPQTVPAWVETLEFAPAKAGTSAPNVPAPSVFRVRLARPRQNPGEDLQLRVFFRDGPDSRPEVTAWDELGRRRWTSGPLGEALHGLPTSEAVTVPMRGVDYLEIAVPGDGATVRGAFLSWLERREIREPVDFPSVHATADPESAREMRILSAARRRSADGGDGFLYGTVRAGLQVEPVPLAGAGPGSGTPGGLLLEFELEKAPLVALLSFELLSDAPVSAPPQVFVNGQNLGRADLLLPDLSDPGYQGETHTPPGPAGPAPGAVAFRYTGWLRAQKPLLAPALAAGLNKLLIQLSDEADSGAVRVVELQLKYSWEKLDYVLSPAAPPANPAYEDVHP